MIHLAIDSKDFSYLNYLSVMSAVRFNDVTMWTRQEPEDNEYWRIVKNLTKNIEFREIDPVSGITVGLKEYTGRLDIIYMAEMTDRMFDDAFIDHTKMYEVDGEFEDSGIVLVRVYRPELITKEYVAESGTAIAELIKKVLFERVWNR